MSAMCENAGFFMILFLIDNSFFSANFSLSWRIVLATPDAGGMFLHNVVSTKW